MMASEASKTRLEDEFHKAAASVARRKDVAFGNDVKLEFYALYKAATVGPCNDPQPSLLQFVERAKWQAWKKLGTISSDSAMEQYIELVEKHIGPAVDGAESDGGASTDTAEAPSSQEKRSMGVSVSVMNNAPEPIPVEQRSAWDWAEAGDDLQVVQRLKDGVVSPTSTDAQGLTLLHWAADKHLVETAKEIIRIGGDVNVKDREGMTVLHYAVLNEDLELVTFFLTRGADISLTDNEGETPVEMATPEFSKLLAQVVAK
ncbi:acyl-CoA-binding protein [Phlyctochytrium arcticum]|nr:acyl-CoA-binding protein [Phlyctochytrium arcticum]